MRKAMLAVAVAALPFSAIAADVESVGTDSRSVNTLTSGWRYWSGDPVLAADPSFDETKWEKISIPHS